MANQEDYLDIEIDDDCYNTSWSMINMWFRRARKLQKIKEQNTNQDN